MKLSSRNINRLKARNININRYKTITLNKNEQDCAYSEENILKAFQEIKDSGGYNIRIESDYSDYDGCLVCINYKIQENSNEKAKRLIEEYDVKMRDLNDNS